MSFSHLCSLVVFHWSLSDSKFPQAYRTLLCILSNLNNVVVWIVSNRLLLSNSSGPLSNPLGTVPSALTTIGISHLHVTQLFHFSIAKPKYLLIFSLSFIFTLWSTLEWENVLDCKFSLSLLISTCLIFCTG